MNENATRYGKIYAGSSTDLHPKAPSSIAAVPIFQTKISNRAIHFITLPIHIQSQLRNFYAKMKTKITLSAVNMATRVVSSQCNIRAFKTAGSMSKLTTKPTR